MPFVIKHKEKSTFVFLLNRNTYGGVSNKILTVFIFQNGVTAAFFNYYCFHAFYLKLYSSERYYLHIYIKVIELEWKYTFEFVLLMNNYPLAFCRWLR